MSSTNFALLVIAVGAIAVNTVLPSLAATIAGFFAKRVRASKVE
jgi:hypothetical protein